LSKRQKIPKRHARLVSCGVDQAMNARGVERIEHKLPGRADPDVAPGSPGLAALRCAAGL